MDHALIEKAKNTYTKLFEIEPSAIISAPGRINLIGEHTDYSDGFVLPVAIHLNVIIAMTPRDNDTISVYSVDFDEKLETDLKHLEKGRDGWQEYVKAVAWALMDSRINIKGWQGVIAGNIPIGAGLSSSAALEVAIAKAFCLAENIHFTPSQLAQIAQKAEIDWVGVNVGIMDQLISAAGKKDHAVLLDCRTLDFEYVPIPNEVSFIVLDTLTRRELTQSAYNKRHEEVKMASQILGITTLRDATLTLLENKKESLSPTLYKRARHVLTENDRVHNFNSAMRKGDISEMGRLINDSHRSLRDDFEVSSLELNLIVDLANSHSGCLGARMTGAGFGGCALAMIETKREKSFINTVCKTYHEKTGTQPHIFKTRSANGVHIINKSDDL